MSNNNDFSSENIMDALESKRKEQELEAERRYADRRMKKEHIRDDLGGTAERLHAAINIMLDDPGRMDACDVRNLCEALNHITSALGNAEHYANARPVGGALLL